MVDLGRLGCREGVCCFTLSDPIVVYNKAASDFYDAMISFVFRVVVTVQGRLGTFELEDVGGFDTRMLVGCWLAPTSSDYLGRYFGGSRHVPGFPDLSSSARIIHWHVTGLWSVKLSPNLANRARIAPLAA